MTATHQQSGHRLQLIENNGNMGIFKDLEENGLRVVCPMNMVIPYYDRSEVLEVPND